MRPWRYVKKALFSLFIISQIACSGLERSEYKKIRKQHAVTAKVTRKKADQTFSLYTSTHAPGKVMISPYSWQDQHVRPPRITKEWFQCKGSCKNPSYVLEGATYEDCGGSHEHSLPKQEGKEHIYPILLDLLNHIQYKTGKKIIITSGHRCPRHNAYVDPSLKNRSAKHQIGAQVDFYVEGLENRPMKIVRVIQDYYKKHHQTKNQKKYTNFRRSSGGTGVSIWSNQEVSIAIYPEKKGRNKDNTHPYPYLSCEVLFDKKRDAPVSYTWEKAHKNITFR